MRFLFVGRVMREKAWTAVCRRKADGSRNMATAWSSTSSARLKGRDISPSWTNWKGWCAQVSRLSVGYEALLRHGKLRGAAVVSRGYVQCAAGGCRLRGDR